MTTGGIVLVTGATGFVGRALVPALAESGHTVRAVGRAETGDIGPDTDWRPLVEEADAVIHLAARVHVMHETDPDPEAAFQRMNAGGTETLARAASEAGVARFVFLSSVKVNGETSDRPLTAADTPRPEDAYGRSKLAGERALARSAGRMATVVLRPPLVYGPEVRGNFLSLLKAVDRGWPLPLGGIANRRSLIYRGNLIEAILAALEAPPGLYLPRDGVDLSTPELIRRVAAAFGRTARLIDLPPALLGTGARIAGRADAFRRLAGSLTVDGTLPGWTPRFTIEEGLAATAAWYRRHEPR